jgi:hypothetical protein
MSRQIAFLATCPTCGHPRLQAGYTRGLIRRFIDINQDIEAYCLACDLPWTISAQERFMLAKAVMAQPHTVLPDEYVARRKSTP